MNPPSCESDRWAQTGFRSQQAGDLTSARAAYQQALRLNPRHAAALQLLGSLARREGDAAQAERLMRQSLAVDDRQPHVWNNLANLLTAVGRHGEALDALERALTLHPAYAEAHYNRARVLQELGRGSEALVHLQQAIRCTPTPAAPHAQLMARIQDGQGDVQAALSTLTAALRQHPDHTALLHNQATLLQRLHRPAEALPVHERALALGLDAADAHYNHGNTLQSLGRLQEAASAYRQALRRQPVHELALFDLARLRWRLGDEAFDADLVAAAHNAPASPVPHALRGQLMLLAGRPDEAARSYEQALVRAPTAAGLHDGVARSLARQGRLDASLQCHERALALAPTEASLKASAAMTLMMARRPQEAQQQAEAACSLAPEDQLCWALLGLATRLTGDARAPALTACDHLVQVVDLEPPAGFNDMAQFNEQLAHQLRALHLDRAPPVDQTLRGGTQTLGDIFEQRHPLVDALKQRIAEAIDGYIAALPDDRSHPVLRRKSAAWRFTDSWSSRLGTGGFHTNHVHPHGWLSSAYYVTVPAEATDGQRRQGWLQFGEPDFDSGLAEPVLRQVQPKPGRLALFPSMFWHGTTPFATGDERLTIAFDVRPVTARN